MIAAGERRYVAYYRVSTGQQRESGLGLESQQAQVRDYLSANHGRLIGEYLETVSGRKKRSPPTRNGAHDVSDYGRDSRHRSPGSSLAQRGNDRALDGKRTRFRGCGFLPMIELTDPTASIVPMIVDGHDPRATLRALSQLAPPVQAAVAGGLPDTSVTCRS